eukprot:CAMPEP_0206175190 /NCGR_PEP_ID=MMETSP1474-20131121/54251_1 /ASSEMBLY_ACC=CAM_ASM_001110 /TAXON_ID=97495 /ORGANISM="Imantonia sp., Strain RCC918" /LENGTH=39 /DNA_ID= /DNA_START= /DNA_END= /DNA_ORIENTATION=
MGAPARPPPPGQQWVEGNVVAASSSWVSMLARRERGAKW